MRAALPGRWRRLRVPGAGRRVCLNPLEALIRDRRPEAIHRARMDLMLPLAEAALGRSLRPADQTGVDGAVRLSAAAAGAEDREPTLRDVLEVMFEPGDELAGHMRTPVAETRRSLREAAYGLRRLVDGDLCGMFDGPTTAGIDLEAPLVAFDLSRITDYTSLGVVMICVAAWLRQPLAGRGALEGGPAHAGSGDNVGAVWSVGARTGQVSRR